MIKKQRVYKVKGSRRLGIRIKKRGDRRAWRTNVEDEWQDFDFHQLAIYIL